MRSRAAIGMALGLALAAGPAGATDLVDFARCITRAGATFYTAGWCPHCARQSRMFGNGLRYLRTVDCTRGCRGVQSLPTWTFADGSRVSGVLSLADLGSRTRCQLGAPTRREEPEDGVARPSSAGPGARERYLGGMKIIELNAR